jgi:ABC-type branched-subunit amino acid transport system ATPase component
VAIWDYSIGFKESWKVLEATDIEVRFGGVRAVNRVSLTVNESQIFGLVGPNGSGKSTFLNALTGVVSATGGLAVNGKAVPLGNPAHSRSAGIMRTYQTPQIYLALTCVENVLLSTTDRSMTGALAAVLLRRKMLRNERRRWDRAVAALSRVGLDGIEEHSADGLSYGDRRILELARAIAGEPKVLMLDEPSAGLNEQETAHICEILTGLRADGITLLVVDHKINFISDLCDRVAVLATGSVIAEGTPEEVWANQQVIDAYLGVEGA